MLRVHLPPLRERPDDIVPLARHLLAEAARANDVKLVPFSEEALEQLARQPWPGNVRQLRNVVESALIRAVGRAIEPSDLSLATSQPEGVLPAPGRDLPKALDAFERTWIVKALGEAQGSVPLAAARLGLPERTLRYKLEKFGLEAGTFRSIPGSS